MKRNQFILAGLATAMFAGVATADVTIYIGGSTAFRKATYGAVKATLNPLPADINSLAGGGAGANQWTMKGTVAGIGGVTTVKASFTGSAGGVDNVVNGKTVSFLVNTTPNDTATELHIPDIAMSDSQQASTAFTTTTLTDDQVGVIVFAWVKGVQAPADLVNITAGQAANLLTFPVPTALITGNPAETQYAFPIGRDDDSGTRIIAFAESGFGITSQPKQFSLTAAAVPGNPPVLALWPAVAPNPKGYQGYASGSAVATALKLTGTALAANPVFGGTGINVIGYAGLSDANSVLGTGQVVDPVTLLSPNVLTYNGVACTTQNIVEGAYSFWAYEHMLYKGGLAADYGTFIAACEANMDANATASGLALGSMHCSRQNDASPISHN